MIPDVIYSCHDDTFGGHLGIKKTMLKIKERFFWPKMTNDITQYVKTCMECQTKKAELLPKAGLLQPIEV